MCDNSVIPSFDPSEDWYADWPYGVSTSVRILASVIGAATRAVQHVLEPLSHNPDVRVPAGVDLYYQGGITVEIMQADNAGALQIVLASAGEDGFDLVLSAADDLAAALRGTSGEVRLTWHELAATRAP